MSMEASSPTREARRLFIAFLAIKLAFFVVAAAVAIGLSVWEAVGYLPAMAIPTAAVLVITVIPWFQRTLGTAHLALVLAADVLFMSMRAMPTLFLDQTDGLHSLALMGVPVQHWLATSLAEPFLLLLVPLVLFAWAYGRHGAVWASTWATLLHLGTGFWAMNTELLGRGFMTGEVLRISLIYAVPLMVSTLARRERRQLAELEEAHARLQRYAATAEHLAVSRERNRLARDLHDTLAHSLAALTVHLESLRTLLAHDPAAAQGAVDEALGLARSGLEGPRQAIQELRQDPLDTLGLVEAVRAELLTFEARTGISTALSVAGQEPDLADHESRALFRIVEETLSNVERHASAHEVTARLAFGGDRIDLSVRDDGVGFEPAAIAADRYGITGMQERAAIIGAKLEVRSYRGSGTEVWCTLAR